MRRSHGCSLGSDRTRPQVAPDTETGQTHEVQERSARAVLADILGAGRDRDDNLSATTLAEREDEAARSVMVAVNRLAEEAAAATARATRRVLRLEGSGVVSATSCSLTDSSPQPRARTSHDRRRPET